MPPPQVELHCDPDLAQLQRLNGALADFANLHRIQPDSISPIRLALEEIVVNILHHGFDGDPLPFIVRLSLVDQDLHLEIEDYGRPFNPLEPADPDTNQDLDSRPIGGLGVFLVRRLMDRIDYRRAQERNILNITKRIVFEA